MERILTNIKNFFINTFNGIKNSKLFTVILKEQEPKIQINNWLALLIHFVISFVLELIIESFSRHGFGAGVSFMLNSTHIFFYNTLLIFVTSLLAFLFRKRLLLRVIIFTTWLALGVSNGIILSNRVTPLTGPDLKNVTEALGVVKKYFNMNQIIMTIIFSALLIFFILIYVFRCPKYKGKMHYVINIIAIAVSFYGLTLYTNYLIENNVLSSYFSNIAFAYQDYGFPYCFTVTVTDTGIDEPNHYSEEMVNNIINHSNEKVGETTLDLEDKPNVIVVQLESFFDPTRINYFELSEDPISYWHELSDNYTSGFLTVPTVGAGTVNTEFEILTGMSMRFFGAGEYPYKGVLLETTAESSAFVMKNLGYTCFALHDNEANFYSRKKVYKNIGFDYFISGEYMLNQNDVNENGWMRDENLIAPILECLDSTEGTDYIFTVSVQPHGSYPTEQVYENPLIQVNGDELSDERRFAWEYYVNQLYEEDQFVRDLIAAVEERGEKTIIVFYGDHQPTMNIKDSELTDGTIYDTCYLIWDNIGLEEEDEDLHSYQLFAKVLEKLDIHEGNIFKFQQSNFDGENENFLLELQTLQYDILYGNRYLYAENELVINENYRLGLEDPIVESVEKMNDEVYIVHGYNFTQSSKVFIDKVMADTIFLDENSLFILRPEITEQSNIRIGVQSNSSTHKILSYGPYYYLDPTTAPMKHKMEVQLAGQFNVALTEENDLLTTVENVIGSQEIVPYELVASVAEEGYLEGFVTKITGFNNAVAFKTIEQKPFIGYIFETDDIASLMTLLQDSANLKWNAYVQADNKSVVQLDDTHILFVMYPKTFVEE